ncbi:MAG: alpha/beta hydrolase [Actinomycetales bacterium]|nr:MAG: alpha/beta hydrolase [Actinomycetales bacterium]
MALDPQAQAYLNFQKEIGAPNVITNGVYLTRKASHENLHIAGPIATTADISHRFISTPTADIAIRIYTPKGEGPFGGMMFFHGGGWVLNHINKYDSQLVDISAGTNSVVISVNYQKSPEHKFPIPLDDCYSATEWFFEHASEMNVYTNKIGVAGDSAGATLSAAISLRSRDEKAFKLAYQALMYPATALDFETSSYLEYATGLGLTREGMMCFWDAYISEADKTNPYAVVSEASDLSNLPPAIIAIPEYDVLRDETVSYSKALAKAGNTVINKEFPGQIHGFFAHAGMVDASYQLRRFLIESINSLIKN